MYWRNVGGEEHAYTKIWGNTVHCSTAQNLTLLTGIPVPTQRDVFLKGLPSQLTERVLQKKKSKGCSFDKLVDIAHKYWISLTRMQLTINAAW